MQMDGLPGDLSSYPRSDSPSGYHLSSGESEALSVIPRGSWGDVARRFTMIRWVVRKCGFGVTNVLSQRLAVSLNHWGSYKYWFLNSRKRIPRITEDIRQDIPFHRLIPSINIRHQGQTTFIPQYPTPDDIA
ncbi:hypothetical protein F511_05675 [Dorcoceras hygrometricum]|uniref:Uncharacterized protein n=1 Tax=Dorcoceras hygrometricum TaxID=472368 RepID=A0A2Z7C2W1_9LAMI|nr:hypothetical protein F511_05675 [Dorcoceras hygrometricum]